jgi:type II secretory pathway pseudopilin PulG
VLEGPSLRERKGLAVASLVLGILGLPTLGLLGVGAIVSIVLGVAALAKARDEPRVYGGKKMAVAGIACAVGSLLVAPFLGIVAAIAIPSLLRARVAANESAVIGDIRTVISAEAIYQDRNGGYYGTLECLNAPQACLPRGAATTPLLPLELVLPEKGSYRRRFYPGPGTRQFLRAYAYVAFPSNVGQTAVRTFCGDSTGRICFTTSLAAMTVEGGLCPKACQDLR